MESNVIVPFSVSAPEDRRRLAQLLVTVGNAILNEDALSAEVEMSYRLSDPLVTGLHEVSVFRTSMAPSYTMNLMVSFREGVRLPIPPRVGER